MKSVSPRHTKTAGSEDRFYRHYCATVTAWAAKRHGSERRYPTPRLGDAFGNFMQLRHKQRGEPRDCDGDAIDGDHDGRPAAFRDLGDPVLDTRGKLAMPDRQRGSHPRRRPDDDEAAIDDEEVVGLQITVDEADGVACLDTTGDVLEMTCLLYTSPSPRERTRHRMPSSA